VKQGGLGPPENPLTLTTGYSQPRAESAVKPQPTVASSDAGDDADESGDDEGDNG